MWMYSTKKTSAAVEQHGYFLLIYKVATDW
jgi:hypothetical protein